MICVKKKYCENEATVVEDSSEDMLGRKQIRLNLSPAAEKLLRTIRPRTGVIKETALARIVEWFTELHDDLQLAVITDDRSRRDKLLRDALRDMLGASGNIDDLLLAAKQSAQESATFSAKLLQRVEELKVQRKTEQPEFSMNVAAGEWVDVDGIEGEESPGSAKPERFSIRIAGDSMEPNYANGSTIIFKKVDPEKLKRKQVAYVQRADGKATFKMVWAVGENQIRLIALNLQKYPDEMHVDRSKIVYAAIAEK